MKDIFQSFFDVYRLHLLQALPEMILNRFTKSVLHILLLLILLQALFISSAYVSGLSAILTLPMYAKTIQTRQDLIESKMEWGANDEAWIGPISRSTNVLIQFLVSLHCKKSTSCKKIHIVTSRYFLVQENFKKSKTNLILISTPESSRLFQYSYFFTV